MIELDDVYEPIGAIRK